MKNKKTLIVIAVLAVVVAASIILGINLTKKDNLKKHIDTKVSYNHETIYNQDGVSFDIYTFDNDVVKDVDKNKKFLNVTNNNIDNVMKIFEDYKDDIYHMDDMLTQFNYRFDPEVTVSAGDKYLFQKDDDGNYLIVYYDVLFEAAFIFEYNY